MERDNQAERFINFSDAVIAIAVTLLVLPLVELAAGTHDTSIRSLAQAFEQPLWIFLLSFIVICRYWLAHHRFFQRLSHFNPQLFWLNASWLLFIVLTPFTSELIGHAGHSAVIIGLYIGNLLAISYLGVAIQIMLRNSTLLLKPEDKKAISLYPVVSTAIAMTIAFCVAIAFPAIGPWALLILAVPGLAGRVKPARRGEL